MNSRLEALRGAYASALQAYLAEHSEAALASAYELGRRAIAEGLGVLDMISLHEETLAAMPATPAGARGAADFLRELLSPFELAFRGYRDANDQLKRLNEALTIQNEAIEAANRELEAFSYSVSHDLRAPLRAIDGFSQALLDDHARHMDEEASKYLRHVRDAAREMDGLIEHLLLLARVGRGDWKRTPVDLSELARRVAERLRAANPSRRVELAIADGLAVDGDARLLDVVLQNLLGNAWKFTSGRRDARIELGAYEDEGRSVYFVRDNGVGFDMAYATKLFRPFQRLHSTEEFEGTGIGLATVQRIVRRHGGDVWAEGEVGRGATIRFTLAPKKPPPRARPRS